MGLSLLLPSVEFAAASSVKMVAGQKYNLPKKANNFDCIDRSKPNHRQHQTQPHHYFNDLDVMYGYIALFLSYMLTEFCTERCEHSEILEM